MRSNTMLITVLAPRRPRHVSRSGVIERLGEVDPAATELLTQAIAWTSAALTRAIRRLDACALSRLGELILARGDEDR